MKNAPRSFPRSTPKRPANDDLESPKKIPLAPPSWTFMVVREEEDEDVCLTPGKKDVIPPLVWSVVPWHSGPPSSTSSIFSTGPSLVSSTVRLMFLVQETVLVVTWLVAAWLWASDPQSGPKKSPSPRASSSVIDLEEVEKAEEGEDDDEDVDEENEVPGTLEMFAGEDLEPSCSKINWEDFT